MKKALGYLSDLFMLAIIMCPPHSVGNSPHTGPWVAMALKIIVLLVFAIGSVIFLGGFLVGRLF